MPACSTKWLHIGLLISLAAIDVIYIVPCEMLFTVAGTVDVRYMRGSDSLCSVFSIIVELLSLLWTSMGQLYMYICETFPTKRCVPLSHVFFWQVDGVFRMCQKSPLKFLSYMHSDIRDTVLCYQFLIRSS